MPDAKVFLDVGRRRRDRHRGQARAALLAGVGRAASASHLISRIHGYHGTHGFGTSLAGIEANRAGFGAARPRDDLRVAHDDVEALEAEIERLGAGERRRVLLRAGDRRRRRLPAAARLHRGRRRAVRERTASLFVADCVICGFGRLGSWCGVERFGRRAGHDHLREGRHERLPAARRRRSSAAASPSRSGTATARRSSATARRTPAHATCCAAGARQPRHPRARGAHPARRGARGRPARPRWRRSRPPARSSEVRGGTGLLAAVGIRQEVLVGTPGRTVPRRRRRPRRGRAGPRAGRGRRRLAAPDDPAGAPVADRRRDRRGPGAADRGGGRGLTDRLHE